MTRTADRHTLNRWFEQISDRPPPEQGSKRELAYTIIRASHGYLQSLSMLADDEYGVVLNGQRSLGIRRDASIESVRLTITLRVIYRSKEDPLSPYYRGGIIPAERIIARLAQAYTLIQALDFSDEVLPMLVREDELLEELNRPDIVDWITANALVTHRPEREAQSEWAPVLLV